MLSIMKNTVVVSLLLCITIVQADRCPKGCTCVSHTVSCTGLSEFPDLSKTSFSHLDIHYASLPEIPANAVETNVNLESFVITDSVIKNIKTCAFNQLYMGLFSIQNTQIDVIEPRAFSNITFVGENGTFEMNEVTIKTIDSYAFMYLFSSPGYKFSISHSNITKIKPAAFFYMYIDSFSLTSTNVQHIKTTAFLQFQMKTIDISDTYVKRLDCGAFFRGKGDYSMSLRVTCDCDIVWMVADKLVSAFNKTRCEGPTSLAGSYLVDLTETTLCPSGFFTSGCAIKQHALPQECLLPVKPTHGAITDPPPIIG